MRPFWIVSADKAERERGAGRAGGVLRVVRAAQRTDAADLHQRARGAARGRIT